MFINFKNINVFLFVWFYKTICICKVKIDEKYLRNLFGEIWRMNFLPLSQSLSHSHKRGTKDTKGTVKLINLKQTDNAMAKYEDILLN